jgi:hypothetical protein
MCTRFLRGPYFDSINKTNSAPYPLFFKSAYPFPNGLCPSVGGLNPQTWPNNFSQIQSSVVLHTAELLPHESGYFYVPLNLIVRLVIPAIPGITPVVVETYVGPFIYTATTAQSQASAYEVPFSATYPQNTSVYIIQKKPWDSYINNMCTGAVLTILDKPLSNYSTGNPAGFTTCDEHMVRFCNTPTNWANPDCSCVSDERLLNEKYPELYPSPLCFGGNCSHQGYRTQRMIAGGCSIAVCEDFVESVQSSDVDIQGQTTIVCDQTIYDLPSSETPVTPPVPTYAPDDLDSSEVIPSYVWVLVAFTALFIIIAIGAFFWNK